MHDDIEIARSVKLRPITEIAGQLGIPEDALHLHGRHKAKVDLGLLDSPAPAGKKGRLVLVTGITPTPAGEGKTTTSIGLAQGLCKLGEQAVVALREPSLGPCFGMKGGATGGGRSQVAPAESINLHFTGDFHAVSAAHNLLAALLDNDLHFGGSLGIDPRRVLWKRVIDMNDRSLRRLVIGLGGPREGVPRESGFTITAASEVMAMICLAEGYEDLRSRLDRTLVAMDGSRHPITAGDLGATGAMLALLKDALLPNLVQTLEGTPAFIHGGPFANIAHGCSSVLATRMGLRLADWTITEAGFGFDLGGEKFYDIKCGQAGLDTAAVVLVATVRALKMHGGRSRRELHVPDAEAVDRGLPNLEKHVENIRLFNERPVVCLNRFEGDTEEEIARVRECCDRLGTPFAVADHVARGGEGAVDLALAVQREAQADEGPYRPVQEPEMSIRRKIEAVATRVYGAGGVEFDLQAQRGIEEAERLGYGRLPVCIAKTQSSLSDDPRLLGRPEGFDLTVRRVTVNAGAGFLVALTGDILRMPGLPRRPQARHIDLVDGRITGIG